MRSIYLIIFLFVMSVISTAEVLTVTGDTISTGTFSVNGGPAADFSGTPFILKVEIDADLTTFNNNSFDASGEVVVLGFSLIFPGLQDVFTANVGTFNQGLRDVDVNDGINLLSDDNRIRILPRDVNELGPALDGENLAQYFSRTGGEFVSENQIIIVRTAVSGLTFTNSDGDIVTLDANFNSTAGSNINITVPEPTTYLLLLFLGFCFYTKRKKE
ncbi:PEP-CTERM sorting domain-containing protein [Candidatus Uabimicrobium sp. HlEnr_7]|uniref:PEP-CTERM sorting domain-containing protein n=1 Tax=Candidatus Uabimicrobium helgolandensis TaxID=3095367 RepID=UPI00355728F3